MTEPLTKDWLESVTGTESWLAGVDEAGRGPLAGPVVVAAVVLDPARPILGLNDSKRLSTRTRERLAPLIRQQALAWSLVEVGVEEIDRINILQATLAGMRRTVRALPGRPARVLVDGNRLPARVGEEWHALVGGDGLEPAIGAASILAKVHRDQLMGRLHQQYPGYGFDRHKGYPTAVHLEALRRLGPCPEHRRSFRPVREVVSP